MFCGVDIKGNEANIVLCERCAEKLVFVENNVKKIPLDASRQEHFQSFIDTFCTFVKLNKVEKIYLKKPMDKGQRTAGANAFRIEALLNLCTIPVCAISAVSIAAYLKKTPIDIQDSDKVLKYQQGALEAVHYGFLKLD